jgi:CHAD domain-containing protein
MSPAPKSATKIAAHAEQARRQRHLRIPQLNAAMASDTAFRIVARRCVEDLSANHEATCSGDTTAVHEMRIALTRLRTAILFFWPMIDDPRRPHIKHELKWLNAHLGAVRDLDVAIERLEADNKRQPQAYRSWIDRRTDNQRLLARALRSVRYRRLIESLSDWIETGPWSIRNGKNATQKRALPIGEFSADKLARWQQRLLKKSRKLKAMGATQRHRLRLLNKKLCYSIGFFEDLFSDKRFSRQQAALKYLRKAQRSLGRLNDDANGHSLAATLQRDGIDVPLQFLDAKREKRLIRTAAEAYQKLAAMKP